MRSSLPTIASTLHRLSPLLALVFLFLWLRACNSAAQQVDRYQSNLDARDSQLRSYRLSNGQLAHDKDLLEVIARELKNQVWIKDDSLQLLLKKLKDPVLAVQWKTRYRYDTVFIPVKIPVTEEFQRHFSKQEEWFSLSGSLDRNGISIKELSIPNTQRLVVGHKNGKPVVSVTNSNPFIITDEMEGQLVKLPRKHWVLGVGATWNIYEAPSGGVFFGYKLLEL